MHRFIPASCQAGRFPSPDPVAAAPAATALPRLARRSARTA